MAFEQKTCWICGAEANSAEHRIKKKDLVRAHGRGPYVGQNTLLHFRSGKQTGVQGPGSNVVKYAPSLCHDCNTAYTQPFDLAYDRFIDWVMSNEELILHRRFVDFEEIFGSDWPDAQRDLYKYFAKSFGCRLVDADAHVPCDIVQLLGQPNFHTGLRLSISVNEDILLMPPMHRNGFLGKGDLLSCSSKETPNTPNSFTWNEHISWLTIFYWYNCEPDGGYGTTWVADGKYVYLGCFSVLNENERLDLVKKTKDWESEL